jgi:hypothetical protein
MSDDLPTPNLSNLQFDAREPWEFGITTEGELIIRFVFGQSGISTAVTVPPKELRILRRLLDETATIQGMLEAVPPKSGAH